MAEFLRILIIDDSRQDRETLRRFLIRTADSPQFEVLEAETGAEGFRLFTTQSPDVVLLDLRLPDMSGLDLLSQILAQSGPHGVATLMLASSGNEMIAVEAMKIGVLDYLNKSSLTAAGLRRAIRQALEKARMERQLEEQRQELAQKNLELQIADRRKDDYLALVAHELRNPLMAIRNAVELVKRLGSGNTRFQEAVEVLERQVRHQSTLLDDLLDVSRITRGKIQLRLGYVSLNQLVRDAMSDTRSAFEAADIRCSVHLPEETLWVHGDLLRLGQTLGNLLHNALKFTPSGGRVEVHLERHADEAHLRVRDTGIGISPEIQPQLFGLFIQGDCGLAHTQGGLGLGLSVVKGLVELHGGSIDSYSEGIGCGAEFTIRLPLASATLEAGPGLAEMEVFGGEPEMGLRVLIVEDNRDGAETLRELLELSGYEVHLAFSGPEGVDAALHLQPKVVLCDLGLPGMDGFAVARKLRASEATASAYLIAISGYGQPNDRQRSLNAGFDAHITKPLDLSELEKLLRAEL